MKFKPVVLILLTVALASFQLGMARRGIYDEEAREVERLKREQAKAEKAQHKLSGSAKEIAGGVKQATVDSTTGLISETAESTMEEAPVKGTIEGASKGTERFLDNALKGAVKVATLGYGDLKHYEVEEPESGTDDTTKIKIRIPGT